MFQLGYHMTDIRVLKRIRMIDHSGDEGQSFHVHYYFCRRQILLFHDKQEVSHLVH